MSFVVILNVCIKRELDCISINAMTWFTDMDKISHSLCSLRKLFQSKKNRYTVCVYMLRRGSPCLDACRLPLNSSDHMISLLLNFWEGTQEKVYDAIIVWEAKVKPVIWKSLLSVWRQSKGYQWNSELTHCRETVKGIDRQTVQTQINAP